MDQVFREGKRKRRMNKKKNKGIKAIKEKEGRKYLEDTSKLLPPL
jgi:hypothetical protein